MSVQTEVRFVFDYLFQQEHVSKIIHRTGEADPGRGILFTMKKASKIMGGQNSAGIFHTMKAELRNKEIFLK